ncbi:hypothetical protein NEOLEDRAFT_392692 [Neolentinus lepideus HHB14362 ss-1]|uniref:DUF7770 domain-containing protein n=1 Tax=Neolentinus lepideus HHB14362 ss-1 TaxID=1314782 RepID=A0A165S7P6_9AGAM|nr:hypothetical protein NEOLEDRAFT_392692 [Neolentinus lepideus HHB14362 ss-1]
MDLNPASPPMPALQDLTIGIRAQQLTSVIIWCTGGGTLHHWRTSYSLADSSVINDLGERLAGISLDMYQPHDHGYKTADGPNLHGCLQISPRTTRHGLYSTRSGVLEEINFSSAVTVQDIVDLVTGQKRQYYMFNPLGSGCLYWQLQLLRAFVSKGWIHSTDLSGVTESIGKYAKMYPDRVPFPPVEGQFYSPPQ